MPKCERIRFKGNMSRKKDQGRPANKNSWLEFLDTLTSIVIIPVLVLSVICSVIMMNAKRSNNVPNIFGYSLVTILSESMTNSGFEIDDSVMVKNTDPDELKVGDIIAYYKYIETVDANLSEIARTGNSPTTAKAYSEADEQKSSRVSSWKLSVSKVFSNITYTSSEANEKAIKANSSIIFHQIVEIVEYDGYRWFKTWGTSNLDARGDPVYDTYWIREDYIIGRYTHTSSAVRSFLSFASTNSGILWMVEVPSGVHLVLSTLELVEILDMMTKERHERIKSGTYIDRKEYKKMLRAKRKMLASGNIDVEAFKKMYPSYNNYEIVYSETENNKQNVNINGPPTLNGIADDYATLYGTGANQKVGESPPKGRAPDRQDSSIGDKGESPPNRGNPPNGASPPNGAGPPSKESPPNNVGPPNKESPPNNVGPPDKESPPNKNGPPKNKGDTGNSPSARSADSAENRGNAEATRLSPKIDKSVYAVSTGGLYDKEDRAQEDKSLHALQSSAEKHNQTEKTSVLTENEVVLTHEELLSMKDIYSCATADFIADTNLTNKGVVSKPNKKNRIYLVSKKTKRQYRLDSLGLIYSVNSGLITTDSGIYKFILSASGLRFEKIQVDPSLTIISAKQDIFGNVFVGVTGGDQKEVTYKTSDGKLVSIWNRNALLTIGNDFKLYYISMEKSYNLDKGVITDLKVMSKDGKLVSVNKSKLTKTITFIDGFDKYGFMYLSPTVLVLDKGRMLFVLASATTIKLTESQWLTVDNQIVEYLQDRSTIKKFTIDEFLARSRDGTRVDDDSGGTVLAENVKNVSVKNGSLEVDVGKGKKQKIELIT